MPDPLDERIFLAIDTTDHLGYYTTVYVTVGDDPNEKHLALRRGDVSPFCKEYEKDIYQTTMLTIEMNLSVGEYAMLLLRYKR